MNHELEKEIAVMKNDIGHIKDRLTEVFGELHTISSNIKSQYISKSQFDGFVFRLKLVEKISYTLVGVTTLGVLSAVITLVVK